MNSKRALRIIMLLSLMAMLLSCDVFLTSKLGRWNTEDPNAELPDIITVAELQLYCSGGGGDSYISVHRILKSWDAGSVD